MTEPEICGIVDMGELNLRKMKNQNVRPVSEIRNRHEPKEKNEIRFEKAKVEQQARHRGGTKMKNPHSA